MDEEIINQIELYFAQEEREQIIGLLDSLTIDDVTAESELNLKNTKLAILKLSKGNIALVLHYMTSAKKDFRYVICRASKEQDSIS